MWNLLSNDGCGNVPTNGAAGMLTCLLLAITAVWRCSATMDGVLRLFAPVFLPSVWMGPATSEWCQRWSLRPKASAVYHTRYAGTGGMMHSSWRERNCKKYLPSPIVLFLSRVRLSGLMHAPLNLDPEEGKKK